jgi:hypothetical protein
MEAGSMTSTSKLDKLLTGILFLILTSCSDSRAQRFPPAIDYCDQEQRTIPNEEKISRILTKQYQFHKYLETIDIKDKEYLDKNYDFRKVTQKEKDERKRRNPSSGDHSTPVPGYMFEELYGVIPENASDREVMIEMRHYVQQNPLCCQILKPDHLGNEVYNNEGYYADARYRNDLYWGYTSDLFLFQQKPFYKINNAFDKKDLSKGGAMLINACAEFKGFDRG